MENPVKRLFSKYLGTAQLSSWAKQNPLHASQSLNIVFFIYMYQAKFLSENESCLPSKNLDVRHWGQPTHGKYPGQANSIACDPI